MIERIIASILSHRRRIARLVLVAGLLLVALKLWPSWPRETEVEFALGTHHAEVVELNVAYLMGGQAMHGVTFNFPEGAPPTVRHRLVLPGGTILLRCEVRARTGSLRQVTRRLRSPSAGLVRIPLDPGAAAKGAARLRGRALTVPEDEA